ncbi:MAG: hypothetical protein HY892_15610 [Deltaproteobacteria bacterium]|nr:hypothetical protein [Deltaproteobacteria bacterium]
MIRPETATEIFQQRQKRILDVIALSKPDQVPIIGWFGFFFSRYTGLSIQEAMYDPEKLEAAYWKVIEDFEPDLCGNPYGLIFLGPFLEALDYKQLLWAGHGLAANRPYQYLEAEYMLAEEYDHFLFDPTDFMLRQYWPRVFGALKGLEKLPPLRHIVSYGLGAPYGFAPFLQPAVQAALKTLKKAGEKSAEIAAWTGRFAARAHSEGYPGSYGSISHAPFDTLSDFFRGMKGAMLDMYRRPEKVLQACEKLLPSMIDMAVGASKMSGNPRVFIPIHKGIDGLMSETQFLKFYWPTLRELMVRLIEAGLTPCPLWEGQCNSRLEIIKDIPAGKAIYAFEQTDLFKAKAVLGDRVCLRGNVPLSLLATGTPEDVRACVRRLIDEVGRDGGYILDSGGAMDDARVENVQAMFEATREYGVY